METVQFELNKMHKILIFNASPFKVNNLHSRFILFTNVGKNTTKISECMGVSVSLITTKAACVW